MDLTFNNKAIFYYSMSGNTKALVELSDVNDYDIFNMATIKAVDLDFGNYKTLLIGTSTIGRGVPHQYFKEIYPQLIKLEGKDIGLFGSGNSIYDVYCGALDILEDVFINKNKMLFKFKFESYPTRDVLNEFEFILNNIRKDNRYY